MSKSSSKPSKIVEKPLHRLWLFLALFTVFIGYLTVNLGNILLPFIAGFIGAYILAKPTSKLEGVGLNRSIATFLMILLVIFFLTIFGFLALPFLKNELVLLGRNLPKLIVRVQETIDPILASASDYLTDSEIARYRAQLSNYVTDIVSWVVQILVNLVSNGLAIANLISLVILTPFVMFYALRDWPHVTKYIDGLYPAYYAKAIRQSLKKVDTNLGAYARGQVMVCLVLIALYTITLSLLKLPHAFFIGFITGFFAFIPYLGAFMGYTAAMAIVFNQFDGWSYPIIITTAFLTIATIEGYFLTPRLIGERIGLSPVWIIFSLLALGAMFGFVGILFSLPLAAIISTILREFIGWYRSNFVKSA